MNIFTKRKSDSLSPEDRDMMAVELANSYLNMTNLSAWKDLSGYLDRLDRESIGNVENCDVQDLTMASIGELRGVRKTINKIRKHIDFAINGGPKR